MERVQATQQDDWPIFPLKKNIDPVCKEGPADLWSLPSAGMAADSLRDSLWKQEGAVGDMGLAMMMVQMMVQQRAEVPVTIASHQ